MQLEYLTELRERDKALRRQSGDRHPQEGDVVLVYDEKLKRQLWRLGKIENLFRSKDGKIRSAEIKTNVNGRVSKLNRPINKLYPIEVNEPKRVIEDEHTPKTNNEITFIDDRNIPTFVDVVGSM